jgi:integrase
MEAPEQLKNEYEKLNKRGLPKKTVKRIREFIDDLDLQGISKGRQYAYILRLKKIALMIPDKFLEPSEKDIKSVVSKISNTKVKWGSGEAHYPTENGLQGYKVALKKFYKWHLGKNENYPDCVKFIKIGNGHPSRQVKPESLITQDEVNKLIDASENQRDRAIFSTLYDSGIRIGEMLTMKIRDVDFDDYGALIRVTGKTGFRQVRIVGNSIPYLRSWLDVHPDKNNKDAWLFTSFNERIKGEPLTHFDIYSIFRRVTKKSGLKRRIHPHLFRHTRATILASKVVEAPLESQMGWVHGSKQTKTYVHLSLRDQDRSILKGYGIEVKDDKKSMEERPKECPRCHSLNASNSMYCNRCALPLDVKLAIDLDEMKKKVESTIMESPTVDKSVKDLSKFFDPGFKDKMLEAMISQILSNPDMKEKFIKELLTKS